MSVLTLTEIKAHLVLTTTANDAKLTTMLAQAEAAIANRTGPLAPTVVTTEAHDGGGVLIRLLCRPVISVSSLAESYGTFNRTLTEQPLDGSGGGFTAYGYTIEKAEGVIERRVSGVAATFAAGRRNVTVTYTAGWSADGTSATLPDDLELAIKELVRHLWDDSQRGPTARPGSPEEMSAPPALLGSALSSFPPDVEQLLAPFDDIGIG